MKVRLKYLNIFLIAVISLLLFIAEENTPQSKYKYVGVNTCVGACHKTEEQGNQLSIWLESGHSKAYLTLQTSFADSIASARGLSTSAAETPQCIKCHVLGKEIDESELAGCFDKMQGVQCESCHGPGSEYKSLSVMKNKEKALKKGLIIREEKEKFCIQCHNPESPTYFEFDFEQMWEIIAHYKPKE